MRKRIRLHQLRVGMFVEELESASLQADKTNKSFLLNAQVDVERIMKSRAMSVVINTQRGADTGETIKSVSGTNRVRFETLLLEKFSGEEIREARQSVANTVPYIRNLLGEARMNGVITVDSVNAAVDQVMSSATSNPGALLGILRLKKADETTFLHSLAVSALMIAFGRKLGLDEKAIQVLGFGGLVHDLGKMAIPKKVLVKTGKLDAMETAMMRQHPQKGYEMLQKIEGIDQTVLDICLYHHEHWSGAGYPAKLAGEEIPLAARITAICDVYEAMTTVRPYKPAWSQRDTIYMMRDSAGHFDPTLLDAFVSSMIDGGVLR